MSWYGPPPPPENNRPPQTWENAGICPKCYSGDYPAYGRHPIRWLEEDRVGGGGRLEASCHRCGYGWQIEAADEQADEAEPYSILGFTDPTAK